MIPVEEMGELHEKDNEGTGGKPYQIISKETGGLKLVTGNGQEEQDPEFVGIRRSSHMKAPNSKWKGSENYICIRT